MAMQIHGNYDHSGTDYTERVKEKQAVWKAEKAKEAEKAAEGKNSGKLPEPQDELDEKRDLIQAGADNSISVKETVDAVKTEPVIYTKTGEASKSESGTNISVSI